MTAREAANHHDRYRIKERDSQQWVCAATFESEARWVGKVAQFQAGKKEFTAETRIREAGTATETGHLTIPQRGRPRLDFISSHNNQPASPKTILGCAWCLVDVHAKTFRLERNRTRLLCRSQVKESSAWRTDREPVDCYTRSARSLSSARALGVNKRRGEERRGQVWGSGAGTCSEILVSALCVSAGSLTVLV